MSLARKRSPKQKSCRPRKTSSTRLVALKPGPARLAFQNSAWRRHWGGAAFWLLLPREAEDLGFNLFPREICQRGLDNGYLRGAGDSLYPACRTAMSLLPWLKCLWTSRPLPSQPQPRSPRRSLPGTGLIMDSEGPSQRPRTQKSRQARHRSSPQGGGRQLEQSGRQKLRQLCSGHSSRHLLR